MSIPQKMSLNKLRSVEHLTAKEGAELLGVAVKTLERWRRRQRKGGKKAPRAGVQGQPKAGPVQEETADLQAEMEREAAKDLLILTPELAGEYARLLHAGCPAVSATQYLRPQLSVEMAKHITPSWMASALVKAAVDQLNGGTWVSLPAERRYMLALQKHLSELAYFLHSHNFNEARDKDTLEMFKQAREVLKAELKGSPDELDPMQAFARFAMEMMKEQAVERMATGKRAPDLDIKVRDQAKPVLQES